MTDKEKLHFYFDGRWARIESSKLVGTMPWDLQAKQIVGQTRAWNGEIFIYPQGIRRAESISPDKKGRITSKPFIRLQPDEISEVTFFQTCEQ